MQNGNNIFISLGTDTAPIAGTRSDEIQVECETVEISSPTTGTWKQYMAGRKSWSINTNWLIGATADVAKLLNAGTTYTINIYGRGVSSDTKHLTGSAILRTCKITATKGTLCQGSFSFIGVSELAAPSI